MFLGHWQFFKNFFQIAFLRYLLFWFAVVPIFIKFASKLPDEIAIPGFGLPNTGASYHAVPVLTLSLPFSWWLLWLASLSYFFAFLLFHAFCPQFIKRYPSYTDYQTHGHSPRWVIWEFYYAVYGGVAANWVAKIWQKIFYRLSPITQTEKLFDRVITKKYAAETAEAIPAKNPLVEQNQTTSFFKYREKTYRISCDPSAADTPVKEKEIFWEVFGHFAKQAPNIRAVISFLIGLSILLLLIVLTQHIWTVVQLVLL